jgi:chromosome segregation ATPase
MIRITSTALLIVAAITLASSALYAQDTDAQRKRLESQVNLIRAQIDNAKTASQRGLDQQIQGFQASIDSLVRQRVSIDSKIAAIQGQIEDARKRANENLTRQINQYQKSLDQVKSELTQVSSSVSDGQKRQNGLESQVAATQKTGPKKNSINKK